VQREKALTLALKYIQCSIRSLARQGASLTAPTMILPTLGRSKRVEADNFRNSYYVRSLTTIQLPTLFTVLMWKFHSIPRKTQTDARC